MSVQANEDQFSEEINRVLSDGTEPPLLNDFPNLRGLKDSIIVRFRGLIQDNLDRVMKHKKFGSFDLRYRSNMEGIPSDYTGNYDDAYYNVDRYVIVSIPGAVSSTTLPMEAVQEYFLDPISSSNNSKRVISDEPMKDPAKKTRSTEEVSNGDEPPIMIPAGETVGDEEMQSAATTSSAHPIPDYLLSEHAKAQSRFSCIANICDAEKEFKLHDIVEVVGVLSRANNDDLGGGALQVDFNIEVIRIDHIGVADASVASTVDAITTGAAREALKTVLTKILNNDEIAAEYMVLQLVSSRIPGNPALPAMGSWGLNISNMNNVDLNLLTKFLQSIVPHQETPVVPIATSNQVLLKERFYPLRLVENDFTCPGILQLGSGSTVLLDERQLVEGNVNAINVLAINRAVRDQELIGIYGGTDFINFPINLKFVIFNKDENKSMFGNVNPSNGVNGSVPFVHLVANVGHPRLGDSDIALSHDDQQVIRTYIRNSQKLVRDVQIPDAVVTKFENAWVESRKTTKNIPTDDIHVWATLTKIVAASHGKTQVDVEDLEALLQLETTRRQRISQSSNEENRIDLEESINKVAVNGA